MAAEPAPRVDPIDTDALMDELRARVADKKARGLYRADALVRETLDQGGDGGAHERLRSNAVLHQSLAVPASTRPGIGTLIERAKRFIVRASFLNVQGIIDQQSRVNGDLTTELRRLSDEVEGLRVERVARSGGTAAQQDAFVERRARAMGEAHGIESRDALAAAADGAHPVLAVSSPVLRAADAGALVRTAGDLARVVPSGGTLLLAPGESDAVTLAALLTAVGFSEASPENSDDATGERVVIVVARR